MYTNMFSFGEQILLHFHTLTVASGHILVTRTGAQTKDLNINIPDVQIKIYNVCRQYEPVSACQTLAHYDKPRQTLRQVNSCC